MIDAQCHEVSAKEGSGIDDLFRDIASKMDELIQSEKLEESNPGDTSMQRRFASRNDSVRLKQVRGVETKMGRKS